MPISHRHKLIFIHIPKCAGTSVWKALGLIESKENLISRNIPVLQHLLPSQLKGKFVTNSNWDSYKKFTIVRNPFDRIISDYFWLKNKPRFVHPKSFDEFLSLAERVVSQNLYGENVYFDHFYPMHHYFDNINYDFVLRFENLPADFELIKSLHPDIKSLPKINEGKKEILELNNSQKKRITDLYQKDFEMFHYES